jgi:hypothetical protein
MVLIHRYRHHTLRAIGRHLPFREDFFILWKRWRYYKLRDVLPRVIDECERQGNPLRRIQIRTINRCNRTCPFCPVPTFAKTQRLEHMSGLTFSKIVDQLEEMGFDGSVNMSQTNEPFMDPKIIDRCRIISDRLRPKAKIVMLTNGDLLTADKYHRIMPCLDMLMVDNYGDGHTMPPNLQQCIYEMTPEESACTWINMRLDDEVMDTFAGRSPNRKKMVYHDALCILPFTEINVIQNGDVPLCCADVDCTVRVGNIHERTLAQIWGEDYLLARRLMRKQGHSAYPVCRMCDSVRVEPEVPELEELKHRREAL